MKIKKTLFPPSLFAIYLGVLLLMSGIHTGLVIFMAAVDWYDWVETLIPIVYWGTVAVGLTLFTRQKMKNTYEVPLHMMAEATKKVSEGDFSVYVPTIHTADKLDYLDVMILDFNKMVEELGSIETLKTDFVSNVSHEMKTPIAIIKNYAQLLQTAQTLGEQEKEYAKEIEGAAARLSSLISNILRLNKLEHQKITPEMKAYDVCRQLCECILQFEDAWDEKEIELETEIGDMAMVKADASLMELVWNNLISNAIKFTGQGGCVIVRQTSDENTVSVTVSDTGCGMSEESMNHIFDKFYQGDTSHATEGNGLGLALVKRVLELMDGDIRVASEEKKGSAFTVTLPVADAGKFRRGVIAASGSGIGD
ncbi:MAG: HAMP domain-containing histidine kinase [Lachnospiraceae bacterium]|nr:HAMP domain-containing histidine kinase [Lachnospiraceae bacterium]MCM1235783.1 HAMP domain-containing histidine kinase [Ruminococcus flavefaciens]